MSVRKRRWSFTRALDALTSAVDAGAVSPSAIEDHGVSFSDLSEFDKPLVLLVAHEPAPPVVA